MKRRLLFKTTLFGLFLSVLLSCEKNEIAISEDENQEIIGEWLMETYNYTGTSTTSVLGEDYKATFFGTAIDSDLVINFKKNKDVLTTGKFKIKLTTTSFGQTQTVTQSSEGLLQDGLNGTWEVKESSIYIVNTNGEKTIFSIELLTKNRLKLRTIDQRTQTIAGYETTSYTDIIIEYSKK